MRCRGDFGIHLGLGPSLLVKATTRAMSGTFLSLGRPVKLLGAIGKAFILSPCRWLMRLLSPLHGSCTNYLLGMREWFYLGTLLAFCWLHSRCGQRFPFMNLLGSLGGFTVTFFSTFLALTWHTLESTDISITRNDWSDVLASGVSSL